MWRIFLDSINFILPIQKFFTKIEIGFFCGVPSFHCGVNNYILLSAFRSFVVLCFTFQFFVVFFFVFTDFLNMKMQFSLIIYLHLFFTFSPGGWWRWGQGLLTLTYSCQVQRIVQTHTDAHLHNLQKSTLHPPLDLFI